MTTFDWIPINEFSSKYNISQSTLRRRIRSGEIENRFQHGKYWLPDRPISRYFRPISIDTLQQSESIQPDTESPIQAVTTNSAPLGVTPQTNTVISSSANQMENFIESANKMVQELKGAYVTVLHEKEMQIMQLKEEISNLKTLVKILESENDRLSNDTKAPAPMDSWLDKSFE